MRGNSVVAGPFWLIAITCTAVALVLLIRSFSLPRTTGGIAGWAPFAIALTIAFLTAAGALGCRISKQGSELIDRVAWLPLNRTNCDDLLTVRVRKGIWRVFEVEQADHRRRVVLGIGPAQFPANLMPESKERDLSTISWLMDSPDQSHLSGSTE